MECVCSGSDDGVDDVMRVTRWRQRLPERRSRLLKSQSGLCMHFELRIHHEACGRHMCPTRFFPDIPGVFPGEAGFLWLLTMGSELAGGPGRGGSVQDYAHASRCASARFRIISRIVASEGSRRSSGVAGVGPQKLRLFPVYLRALGVQIGSVSSSSSHRRSSMPFACMACQRRAP